MAEASIPVDLTNPGQVFACLGFVEVADTLLGHARGGFDWQSGKEEFRLASDGIESPIKRVLRFFDDCNGVTSSVKSLAPAGSNIDTNKWHVDTLEVRSGTFPCGTPKKDTLPAYLSDASGQGIIINHWGDTTQRRDNVKFWSGAGGYPGAALVRDTMELIRQKGPAVGYVDNPFSLATPQKSSFRFDWRRDYIPIDAGFSPNYHGDKIVMQGYPIVELLAAIGMTNSRPTRHGQLEYSYGVAGVNSEGLYDLIFLRAALGGRKPVFPGMPFRLFTMQLDQPNERCRCITKVFEEKLPS